MFEIRPIFSALLQHKSRAVLIILQMALTLAIVANALFIINQRLTMIDRESGYPEQQIFGFNVVFNGSDDDNIIQQFQLDELMLRAMPGVIDAVAINAIPLSGSGSMTGWSAEPGEEAQVYYGGVFRGDEHTLNTMGVELVAGRNFSADEVKYGRDNAPDVLIISAALADKMFPQGDALGKTIFDDTLPTQIIGIVKTMQGTWVGVPEFDNNVIYPSVSSNAFNRFMIRTEASEQAAVMAQIEEKMLALYPDRVIGELTSMSDFRAKSYRNDMAMTQVLSVIVVLLLFITVVGIFGLSAFSVNQRIRQIGTRRALGASKTDITRYFLVENCLMAIVGIILGCVLALGLNYWLVNEYGVTPLKPLYVGGTMVGIFIVSQLAVLLPALKAAQISPAIATR